MRCVILDDASGDEDAEDAAADDDATEDYVVEDDVVKNYVALREVSTPGRHRR